MKKRSGMGLLRVAVSTAVLGGGGGWVAARATLHGVILQRELGGPPAVGVAVMSGKPDASSVVTEANGGFTLDFPNLAPGDNVLLVITPPKGWVVVNDLELEVNLPADGAPAIRLLISKAEERDRYARQYYRIMGSAALATGDRPAPPSADSGGAAHAEQRIRPDWDLESAQVLADELAKQLAAVSPAQRSETYRKATRLFLAGKLDEALSLLSEQHLRQEAAAARQRLGAATPANAEARRALDEVAQGFLLRGQLLALKLRLDEAALAYGEAMKHAPESVDIANQYAIFHYQLNHFEEAKRVWETALLRARANGDLPHIVEISNRLGRLEREQHRYRSAEALLKKALPVAKRLAAGRADSYRLALAGTHNSLGSLYFDQGRYEEADQEYREALRLSRPFAERDAELYRAELTDTFENLARLEHAQTEERDRLALATYRKLAISAPQRYLPEVAGTLARLGSLHREQGHDDEAIHEYEEAVGLYERLAAKNLERYQPELVQALCRLGSLYRRQRRDEDAIAKYREVLGVLNKSYASWPGATQWTAEAGVTR